MKRIHVFQHVQAETPGSIVNWAFDMGYNISYSRLYENVELPDAGDLDWLVIMGGPMSVHDESVYPWLTGEKKFIEKAISSGKTVVGICLGAQLIANVLGARVAKNMWKEIGWHPVFRTGENPGCVVFDKIKDGQNVFHWHGETFDIPHGAVHGLFSEGCRNQGFIYGDKVLALQFHLEVTPHLLHDMLDSFRDELVPAQYVQPESEILQGIHNARDNNNILYSILDELDKIDIC